MENNTISLSAIKYKGRMMIRSASDFFDSRVLATVSDNKMVFEKIGELDERKPLSVSKNRDRYQSNIVADWENGVYKIDEEESTEDVLVIYRRK